MASSVSDNAGYNMASNEYAAGFFDGEGTVYAATRLNSGKPSPTIIVAISNTVEAPLLALKAQWGGSLFLGRQHSPNRRAQYQWTLAARMARPFLMAIHPHLLIKRDVVGVAIEMCELMALPHKERVDYSNTVFRHGRRWSSPVVRPEFKEKVDALHSRIRLLNTRGAPMNATRRYNISANGDEPSQHPTDVA